MNKNVITVGLVAACVVACGARELGAGGEGEPSGSVAQAASAESGTCTSVTLDSMLGTPQLGELIQFGANAQCGGAKADYEFRLKPKGGTYTVEQKYSTDNSWTWVTAGETAGEYDLEVLVHAKGAKGSQAHTGGPIELDKCTLGSCLTPGLECDTSTGVCACTATSCATGQKCDTSTGQCVCDASTCPAGCCTSSAACATYNEQDGDQCGTGGDKCKACTSAGEGGVVGTCSMGVCS